MPQAHDPFANFERMRRQIDELFGDVFERSGFAPRRGFSPRVDVYYCGDPPKAVVTVDLAGVDIEEVGLEIRGRQLLISGERVTQDAEGRLYQQIEIEQGPFRRVVELGADVDSQRAQANYVDGMLRIEIPLVRQEEAARRVPIEGRERGEVDPG
jgi:HSP20 family protein